MKVLRNDKVKVRVNTDRPEELWIEIFDPDGDAWDVYMTRDQARKLARKIWIESFKVEPSE